MSLNQEWMKKLESEQTLTMSESHDLDQGLDAQSKVGEMVYGLDDPEPSLAWRSSLNEKLLALQTPPKPSFVRRWGLAGFGTAVAVTASVMFVVSARRSTIELPETSASVPVSAEQVLLDAHQGSVFALSTGSGDGSKPIQEESSAPVHHWTEAELEAF